MRNSAARVSLALVLSAGAIGAAAGAGQPAAQQGNHGEQVAASREKIPSIAPGRPAPSPAKELILDLGKGLKLELVLIPAGEFQMGSPDAVQEAQANEKPLHRVHITKPFYLGKYKVMQNQWQAIMGNNPSSYRGPTYPVQGISWNDCQAFIKKLNVKFGNSGGHFCLPTEAQWEYACRAGSTKRWCCGDDPVKLAQYAWYEDNCEATIRPVGEKKPNAWGLYDIHGDVWEWCADWYDRNYYASTPGDDPPGPASGGFRVLRGGSWYLGADYARSARRTWLSPDAQSMLFGFRVAKTQ